MTVSVWNAGVSRQKFASTQIALIDIVKEYTSSKGGDLLYLESAEMSYHHFLPHNI